MPDVEATPKADKSKKSNPGRLPLPPGFRLSLAPLEIAADKKSGVYCMSRVIPVRQSSGRVLLRGEESGGAGAHIGHYVGYPRIEGFPFAVEQPIQALMPNAQHRRVFGAVLLRYEIFRYDKNQVHFLASLHTAVQAAAGAKLFACHVPRVLYECRFGQVDEDDNLIALSRAGEPDPLPAFLAPAFKQILAASRCSGCRHTHLAAAKPVQLPPTLMEVLHLTPQAKPAADKKAKPLSKE